MGPGLKLHVKLLVRERRWEIWLVEQESSVCDLKVTNECLMKFLHGYSGPVEGLVKAYVLWLEGQGQQLQEHLQMNRNAFMQPSFLAHMEACGLTKQVHLVAS